MNEQVRQSWLYWKGVMDVEPILKAASQMDTSVATTFTGDEGVYRRSKIAWLSENQEIGNILWKFIELAQPIFKVQVMRDPVEIQYTEYHATNRGKYDWHHDIDWNGSSEYDRKISVTVQLSDPSEYEGGKFEFLETGQPKEEARMKGTVLMFPSYLQHRVTPVTEGVRKSLVAWFSGPRWM